MKFYMDYPRPVLFGVDVETGGFEPEKHALLAIGCWWNSEGSATQSLRVRVERQEGMTVEPAAAAVNGWKSDEQWRDLGAVGLKYALCQLFEFLETARRRSRAERLVPVAHKASHDWAFIKYALLNCRCGDYLLERWHDHVTHHWRCSLQAMLSAMDAGTVPHGSASLDRLIDLSGQPARSAIHDARDDARCALVGYEWLLAKMNERAFPQLRNAA
jgi:DNA polymerase III epsilon subunit-like protein